MRFIRYLKYRAYNLTLHLPINQNNIFFVINYISHFLSYVPYFCAEVVNYVFQ